jgi:iron complex transport system ATP-binding protein
MSLSFMLFYPHIFWQNTGHIVLRQRCFVFCMNSATFAAKVYAESAPIPIIISRLMSKTPMPHHATPLHEVLRLQQVSIGYRGKVVASDLNGSIRAGQLTCLVGRNGLGKSTLLRTLAGFQPPLQGEVAWRIGEQWVDIKAITKPELARLVSVVLTEKPDVQQMTVAEVVGLGRMPYTGFFGTLTAADRQVADGALALVGIDDFAQRMIETLSDGERQKVMIAKALAQETPVILLDEPTAFLDYPSKVDMMKLLRRLAAETNKAILLSTHDLQLALQLADRLLTLDGRLREMAKDELAAWMAL